ncbi:hypothetical protein [Halobacillus seohaensis]|uniref:Uncharacterized protein n=1 Tax=Halobacillus seohaensis TaxID=447421 RepID=A0ABW2EST7_9BACI
MGIIFRLPLKKYGVEEKNISLEKITRTKKDSPAFTEMMKYYVKVIRWSFINSIELVVAQNTWWI